MEEVESSNLFVSTFGTRRGFLGRGVLRCGTRFELKSLAWLPIGGMVSAWRFGHVEVLWLAVL